MDSADYLRFVLALVFVLGLIGLLAWIVRRFNLGGRVVRSGAHRRLALIEAMPLDGKHRLVLVRRDRVEHLLLLGPQGDVLVECGTGSQDDDTAPGSSP